MEMELFVDDLLNFSVPEEEDDDEDMQPPRNITRRERELRQTDSFGLFNPDDPELVEEEDLEWISNKDAFPVIETFVGVLPSEHFREASPERETTEVKQLSPVSVLETSSHSSTTTMATTTSNSGESAGSNGSTAVATTGATATIMSYFSGFVPPGKARSKRRRTGRCDLRVLWTGNNEQGGIHKKKTPSVVAAATVLGRKCQHCGAEKTPQWRAGPSGPKTLCNACGVRYKSGRLVPEYRPANSPTFSAELHSNSHRKIVEMRKQCPSGDGDRKQCPSGDGDRKDCG